MKRFSDNNSGTTNTGTVTEIESSSRLSVEDCLGVEIDEYDADTLKISTKHIQMRIIGQDLTLAKFTQCCVTVDGKISSVEFEDGVMKK